jgi:hypothetical protein
MAANVAKIRLKTPALLKRMKRLSSVFDGP